MGWTVVEPLSPGVFQIDPSVYGAEHSRVFNVGGGGAAGKKSSKAVALAAVKKLKDALTATMEAAIKLKVGDDVALKMSDDMAKNIGDRAAKNVDTKFPGLKDEAMGPARRQNLINGEAEKLGKGYADNLVKGMDADDLAKGLDVDDVAGFNKWADDAAKLGDDVALTPAQKAAKKKAAKADTAAKLDDAGTGNNKGLSEAQKQVYRMANRTGLSVIALWGAYSLLLPVASAAGDAVGDTGEGLLTIFTGENCRAEVEANYPSNPEVWSEKTEECESQAAFRTMLMGGATVSLLGILGVVLITRLLPAKSEEEEPEEITLATQQGWTMADKAVFGTSKGAGATSDHTDLISTVVLKREGKTLPSSKETGDLGKSIVFTQPAKGDILYWEAETLCDNEPTSDRITVALTFYDPIYIGKLTDIVIDKLSNAEIDQIINGDESPIEKHLTPILDVAQALKQVYSTTVITDSSGKAAGEIPIDEKMQFADYTLTIHYGYAGRAEQSDSGKEYDFWVEEVGLMIVEVVAIIALTFMTAGVGTAIVGGIATAAAIGDIAVAASNYFANGFGAIDENRKGCLFPLMGWNHTYAFVLDEPILNEDGTESNEITESMISQLSPSTEQKINEIKTQYGLQGTSTNLLLVGILAPLLLLVLIPRRKSKSKSKKSKPKEETSDE